MSFGGGSSGSSSIQSSTDVFLSSPVDGQVLSYDAGTLKWVNSTGSGGATTIAGISGLQTALDNKVTTNVTMATVPSGSQFSRNITYALATDNPDIAQIAINGVVKYWHNEWGAIRGTSPYNWGDSLVRAIRSNGDGITGGQAFQLNDRRTGAAAPVMWGVNWADGRMVQGGNIVGAIYALEANQTASDIPASLPAGTLIVRKRAI